MKTTGELVMQLSKVGHAMDSATDDDTRRFLLRARRAVVAAIEAARPPETPYRFTGMSPDGLACYDE